MMISVHPIQDGFVAEVTGIDLALPLAQAARDEIQAALDEYAVLVLPGQPLTERQQLDFAACFGPLETAVSAAVYHAGKTRRLENPQLSDISNLDEQGGILEDFDIRRLINISNQLWHTDSSFRDPPASISMLSAQEIVPVGGTTEFADMRAAWDAMPADMRDRLRALSCEHDYFHSRSLSGHDFGTVPQAWRDAAPPVRHPLVRRHPHTGRASVYLASHIKRVLELDEAGSDALLAELMARCTRPEFVYRHRWRADDLVIWDNRCTMHRGRPFPQEYRRAMRRATVSETGPVTAA